VAAVVLSIAPLSRRLRCSYSGEGDERRITIMGWLKGEEEPFEYTSPPVKSLKKERSKGSPLWHDDPDQQLWYYGVRAWSRKWTPDVIMGVYTPDELADAVRTGATVDGGEVITLTGAVSAASEGEVAKDADFPPVDTLLKKGAKSDAAPKDGAKASGDKGSSEESDKPQGTAAEPAAGSTQTAAAPKDDGSRTQTLDQPSGDTPKSQQTDTPAKPASSKPETDAQLVSRVEAEVKAADPTAKSKPIRDNRAALERISVNANAALMGRADKLLNMFDLDAGGAGD